jgi:predicted metalloendopeptidase
VEKAFSEKAKIFGDQIVSDIKEMFIKKLKKTTWMDRSVVKLAIEKVHKIVQKIGYPTKARLANHSTKQHANIPSEPQYHGSSKPSTILFVRQDITNKFLQ